MKRITALLLSLAAAAITATAGPQADSIRTALVPTGTQLTPMEAQALHMPFRPTESGIIPSPRTVRKSTDGSLSADFSVQDSTSQVVTWAEDFNSTLSAWTAYNGVDDVISFDIVDSTGRYFPKTDAPDAHALHIDGPYQTYRRSVGYITSEEITVPTNGQFHSYVYLDPMWNEYAVLGISVSQDDFANDSTEIWNSEMVTDNGGKWRRIDADLSSLAGKSVRIRLTYRWGTADKMFKMGGYMADFYVADMSVTGVTAVDHINAVTGDVIHFADLSTGNVTSWQWEFPGGTPSTSTEQAPEVVYTSAGSYNVKLTVSNGTGSSTVTKENFVTVSAQTPVAEIGFPAEFRDLTTRTRMVAPLVPVEYTDKSAGYPTDFSWAIYSKYDLDNYSGIFFQPDTIFTTPDVEFTHDRLNKWYVTHIVQNSEGYTFADDSVQVQFEGLITNFRPGDGYQTNFTDGNLTLPGANNLGITAWAEKFSKPSHPMLIDAVYVNFTKASARHIADQIANVSFTLYTSENGLPGQPVDLLDSWTITELGYAISTNGGVVELQLNKKYVINDEFFIVISGIPEKNDSLECAFAMAPMRNNGNTAYMLNKGVWRPFTGYLQGEPGGQTSLAVFPHIRHSVMIPAKVGNDGVVTIDSDTLKVGGEAGTADKVIYSYLGYRYIGSDADWCRVVNQPGEYQADTLKVEYDALPAGLQERQATISLTDSVDTLNITVVQHEGTTTGIDSVKSVDAQSTAIEVYDLSGRRITTAELPRGIYIVRKNGKSRKVVKK